MLSPVFGRAIGERTRALTNRLAWDCDAADIAGMAKDTSHAGNAPQPGAARVFESLYSHGFVRVAAFAPRVTPANPAANARQILACTQEAHNDGAVIALFPELSLCGYAIDDLIQQDALLGQVEAQIADLAAASAGLRAAMVVGAPIRLAGALYNCALVIAGGRVVGAVPKCYLPTYREFYERRQFASGLTTPFQTARIAGFEVPFGAELLFVAEALHGACFGVEICEDLWAPDPPSTRLALAGATVLLNLSASNITIGKARERALLVEAQARRCVASYVYAASGHGESTTDLAWDGQLLAFELEDKVAEGERFAMGGAKILADLDVARLEGERRRLSTFRDAQAADYAAIGAVRRISLPVLAPEGPLPLQRSYGRFPFVPDDPVTLEADCYEGYNIQVAGLATRLESAGVQRAVIGISGGLDSAHALLVTADAFDRLGRPRSDIVAVTMPGFATSTQSKDLAWRLMRALGVDAREVSIAPLAGQMLKDIGHPAGDGKPVFDITYENVQAGLRTDLLFRLANSENGLVVGTGDLSELALGWCTYGVGDHMSHYNVNAGAPKTLIQQLIAYVARNSTFDAQTSAVLEAVLAATISPELVPAAADGAPQSTEAQIGPYALHDFTLHYLVRRGYAPSKVLFLANATWADVEKGQWPAGTPDRDRRGYSYEEVRHWLGVFIKRFFQTSQFKRSAVPNGPKMASAGALSPRGDWRAPSDAAATVWLEELAACSPASLIGGSEAVGRRDNV
ncbi:MAG: NAD(+) synthase [Caulobacterales bacterium]